MSNTKTTCRDGSEGTEQSKIDQQSDLLSTSNNTNTTLENTQQAENVTTNLKLTDFLRCYVQLERCEVKGYSISSNKTAVRTFQEDGKGTTTMESQEKKQYNAHAECKAKPVEE
ncbi:unnamed protein product [Adineta ricciae]|uniref:Uncharacterized protein n=2 Tax=Adineta ricciae TaxID=249248 RepID=A0A815W8F7_ADIRI|nr:unnamed protein product [Adineta ricciae]